MTINKLGAFVSIVRNAPSARGGVRRKRMRRIALMAVLAMSFSSPSMAQLSGPSDCRLDHDVAKILRQKGPSMIAAYRGGGVSYCVGKPRKPTVGWLYTPPRKNELGLCSIRREDIAIRFDKDGPYEPKRDPQFGVSDPQFQLQPLQGDCPAFDGPGYVRTLNVPDGVFLALFDLWSKAHESREGLRSLMANLPSSDRDAGVPLERDLFDAATRPHMRLDSIFPTYGIFLDDGNRSRRTAAYDLRILDERDPLEWYSLVVDWTPAGFVVVGLREIAI